MAYNFCKFKSCDAKKMVPATLSHTHTHTTFDIIDTSRTKTRFNATRIDHCGFVAPESARKIAAKNRSPMPTGIGGSFQLANSASPLGVIDSASAPTARIDMKGA